MVNIIVVERSFDEPTEVSELQRLEDSVSWCLEQYRVRFVKSMVSRDRRHMVCLYQAPDAEAVRQTQETGKLAYDHIWAAQHLLPKTDQERRPGFEAVVVTRKMPKPFGPEEIKAVMDGAAECANLYRVRLVETFLSLDGLRTVCCYDAPDAESVRVANTQAALPLIRAWAATEHQPPA